MLNLTPGTIVGVANHTPEEQLFVVLPSTLGGQWMQVLEVKGPKLRKGECFHRGAPRREAILGPDFKIRDDLEFRLLAQDGVLRCWIGPKDSL